MGYTADQLIAVAKKEVGYLEKASNSQLDNKTANAGSNNWTKYARDLNKAGYYNGNKNGYAWCDVFVDWCFYTLCGKDAKKAQDMICQTGDLGAGCKYSMNYYKQANRLYTKPEPGDQIFFGSGTSVSHTGIVYKVDNTKVYTIEGNTSSASGVVANGGGVFEKSYSLTYSKILGYGRPKYDTNYLDHSKIASWAKTAVYDLKEFKIMVGDEKGNFNPISNITRQEMAVLVNNLCTVKGYTFTSYTDNTKYGDDSKIASWARAAVYALKKKKLMTGDGKNFNPTSNITRQEAAVLINNIYAKTMNITVAKYADDAKIASWAKKATYNLKQAGIMNGKDGNKFDPTGNLTRQEAAVLVAGLIKKK